MADAAAFAKTEQGQELVIWLHKTIDLRVLDDHNVEISIIPEHP